MSAVNVASLSGPGKSSKSGHKASVRFWGGGGAGSGGDWTSFQPQMNVHPRARGSPFQTWNACARAFIPNTPLTCFRVKARPMLITVIQ